LPYPAPFNKSNQHTTTHYQVFTKTLSGFHNHPQISEPLSKKHHTLSG